MAALCSRWSFVPRCRCGRTFLRPHCKVFRDVRSLELYFCHRDPAAVIYFSSLKLHMYRQKRIDLSQIPHAHASVLPRWSASAASVSSPWLCPGRWLPGRSWAVSRGAIWTLAMSPLSSPSSAPTSGRRMNGRTKVARTVYGDFHDSTLADQPLGRRMSARTIRPLKAAVNCSCTDVGEGMLTDNMLK